MCINHSSSNGEQCQVPFTKHRLKLIKNASTIEGYTRLFSHFKCFTAISLNSPDPLAIIIDKIFLFSIRISLNYTCFLVSSICCLTGSLNNDKVFINLSFILNDCPHQLSCFCFIFFNYWLMFCYFGLS